MVKKGLGRGLDALFQSGNEDLSGANPSTAEVLAEIKINDIDQNADQPRKVFDEELLRELSQSIQQFGVLQPIIVKENGARYTLVAGERRWRAARMAGLSLIPAIIKKTTEHQFVEIALIENLQREDLNPIEEAEGIKKLMDTAGSTQEEVASRLGKSRSAVANALRLLALSPAYRALILENRITPGHARALLAIEDESERAIAAEKCLESGLNVRQLEQLAKKLSSKKKEESKGKTKSEEVAQLEKALVQFLGTRVEVVVGEKKGTIHIEFYGEEDLERIIDKMIK